jgi:hypothetical protein
MRTRHVAEMRLEQGLSPSPDPHDMELLRNGIHSLLVRTMQTMDDTGRTVCDVVDAVPWEGTMDLAHQVWDMSRHVEIFLKLLERVEGYSGEAPETTMLERGACAETSPAELTCDALAQLIELAQKIGDPVSERALDVVLADASMRGRKDQADALA